ncbi:hypothetical protein G432_00935 [Sphingomonas sp. MM-1]|uniref:2'-5' RNA ligase family protein n=1 Tax=Sphingomonas sp. MM-1 TaxID=745310 RepID=UPI0002C0E48A|nr:2'-5' RNA ligase family protein [Sphingomonas sp. MM-1]AGH47915.1 hypothetical protein G432_00935 [Sphingomonas sp. MM-1]
MSQRRAGAADGAGALPPRGPIIVTADLGPADLARLDALRRAHYPADRNRVPAHLTLFHHLAPSLAEEAGRRLAAETRHAPPPAARIAGIMKLARGTAFRVDSPGLEAIRARLADAFDRYLTPPDAAPWRPHITIQNKVDASAAAALQREMARSFRPGPIAIAGLSLWRYEDGGWAAVGRHPFNRSGRSPRN